MLNSVSVGFFVPLYVCCVCVCVCVCVWIVIVLDGKCGFRSFFRCLHPILYLLSCCCDMCCLGFVVLCGLFYRPPLNVSLSHSREVRVDVCVCVSLSYCRTELCLHVLLPSFVCSATNTLVDNLSQMMHAHSETSRSEVSVIMVVTVVDDVR